MTKQMDRERLWAKRWTGDCDVPDGAYLPSHLEDVYVAASQVVKATAEAQLAALALPTSKWLERFRRVVCAAAALHDLGKCNSQFQEMLKEGNRQALRHEWVSLLIVEAPGWQEWLLPAVGGNELDWEIVRWSVAGHHPRYDRSAPPELAEGPMRMQLPLDHADMRKIVDWLKAVFDLEPARRPSLAERIIDLSLGSTDLDHLYHRYYDAEDDYDEFPPDLRRFVAAVKDCLVAADVAGSGLPRHVANATERSRWIVDVLDAVPLPDAPDYRRIAAARLKCAPSEVDAKLRHFQKEAARQSVDPNKPTRRVTLIRAGCGTGKTLAAYRWAESDCSGRRLYVCYPTTGTATEGFRDYLLDPELSEHVKTNLEHGRRHVDFEHILHADEDRNSKIARIESLDLWRIPIVACTVDTVLGLVQNNRRGMFGWPALAQSGFVFDEIHSYDDKLFDAFRPHRPATAFSFPLWVRKIELGISVAASRRDC
jgi:CRISPR-associated endonuclease/helicase Cas3